MSQEWVAIVRVTAAEDPGTALVEALRQQFGDRARTTIKQAWLYDAERTPPPPMGKQVLDGNLAKGRISTRR